ncbi:hypothetical protein STRCI_001291 [Streptomyces cinnabarinus]|uniref:DUF3307 domain-containing protein n=1 Tax=Streptomyces cinnabarinus TaxID=67287 RepID=A0ABY7K6S5_9ACTN|nr:hypothetical protein [Streptomyces cinnabarinus]WAZ20192.1 hypothetical protein STRCI_001291 [Streptomyces cinnabarinus]
MTSIDQVATFATVLSVAHNLADHVIGQTDHQAVGKAAPSEAEVVDGVSPRRGWGACLGRVARYHLVMVAMLALVWAVLPLHMSWTCLAAGLAVSMGTHGFFDRRWPVRWLLEHIGSKGFVNGPVLAQGLDRSRRGRHRRRGPLVTDRHPRRTTDRRGDSAGPSPVDVWLMGDDAAVRQLVVALQQAANLGPASYWPMRGSDGTRAYLSVVVPPAMTHPSTGG